MEIKFVSAVILVADIPASRHFYEDILGQKVLMDHGVNVGYEGGFALWEREHASRIVFNRPAGVRTNEGGHQMEIYFESENLDEVHEKMVANGIEFVHHLIQQPWGQRVFRVYDPDHTIVEVGEPMSSVIIRLLQNGLTAEEIAKQTSMPREIILQIAAASK